MSSTRSTDAVPRLPRPGDRIDRYEVIKQIGLDGPGGVFRVTSSSLPRPSELWWYSLAVTGVSPEAAERRRFRFARNAAIVLKVRSPHVVEILDFGLCDTVPYLVREQPAGTTLDLHLQDKLLDVGETQQLVVQVLRGLQAAHEQGVWHRRLSPHAIHLCEVDPVNAKVKGFFEHFLETPCSAPSKGGVIGNPAYMAPEQVRATPRQTATSDVYALGLIAIECITGQCAIAPDLPANASPLELCVRQLNDVPVVVPEEVGSLASVLVKATAKSLDERYDSALEMLQAMERVWCS